MHEITLTHENGSLATLVKVKMHMCFFIIIMIMMTKCTKRVLFFAMQQSQYLKRKNRYVGRDTGMHTKTFFLTYSCADTHAYASEYDSS